MENDILIARWESKGGRYAVELYRGSEGWSYREFTNGTPRGFGCWPGFQQKGRGEQARYGFISFGRRLRGGYFQADANTTPMRRVK